MLKKTNRSKLGRAAPWLIAVPATLIGGLLLIKNYPDLRRYLRIRRM